MLNTCLTYISRILTCVAIKPRFLPLAIVTLFVLAACGGGGGGSGGDGDDDDPAPAPGTATVSGTLSPVIAISYDSDVNDPNSRFVSNDSTAMAQQLDNLVTVHGFASKQPGSSVGLVGRFGATADTQDIYKVFLQAGQQLQLQVVDHDNPDLAFNGDLDLYLLDEAEALVDFSDDETEFESITVAASGSYYILVAAFSGISKYILRLMPPAPDVTATSANVDFVAGEMIVQYQPQITTGIHSKVAQQHNLSMNHQDASRPVLARLGEPRTTQQKTSAGLPEATWSKLRTLREIKSMRQQQGVSYAEPNYRVYPRRVPNDSYYRSQWHYPLIHLPQAWDITTGATAGNPVIVAVVDTGVFLAHPDLQGQLVGGFDFISDAQSALDGNGIDNNPDDPGDSTERGKSSWHGTHVAGTIAARTNNGSGVAGVSWDARVMPLRALGTEGGTSYDLQQAVRYAAGLANDSGTVPPQTAAIVNLSLGGSGFLQSEQALFTQLHNNGVIVVAAAGNANSQALEYPASYAGVVSVSAVDFNGDRAPYSNFNQSVDVAAPGGNGSADVNGDRNPDAVLSTVADDASGTRNPQFGWLQGTSMATPHVAGVAALMKAVYPALTPDNFDALLQSGELTDDRGAAGKDSIYGYGLINALKAVRAAQTLANGGTPPPPLPQVIVTPANLALGQANTSTMTISNEGGAATITDIQINVPWLFITPTTVDSNGLGAYRVQVDRTGLVEGFYQTTVFIAVNSVESLSVLVTMQVGNVSANGKLDIQYVSLTDLEMSVLAQVIAVESGGQLTFQFAGVEAGDYLVFSGSDIDNDFLLCQSGESCGAYPSLSERQQINVQGVDISGLEVIVDILGGLSAASEQSASGSGLSLPRLLQTRAKQVSPLP